MSLNLTQQGQINMEVQRAAKYGPFFIQRLLNDCETLYGIHKECTYKYLYQQGTVAVPWEEYRRRQEINERCGL